MLMHKNSYWFAPGHDEELARIEAYRSWISEVQQRGYELAGHPRIHLIRDSSNPVRGVGAILRKTRGFRIAIQGRIQEKAET